MTTLRAEGLRVEATTGVFGEETRQAPGATLVELRVSERTGALDQRQSQAYFYSPEWQEGEREADDDIRAGRLRRFGDPKEALDHLRKL